MGQSVSKQAKGGQNATQNGLQMTKNWHWLAAGLLRNDLFLRHDPEHVKYVTTDPKTAPSFLGRRPEEAERSAALWVYRLSNEKFPSWHGR